MSFYYLTISNIAIVSDIWSLLSTSFNAVVFYDFCISFLSILFPIKLISPLFRTILFNAILKYNSACCPLLSTSQYTQYIVSVTEENTPKTTGYIEKKQTL